MSSAAPLRPRRALILAGGGIRVAWQAGVVRALDEAGLEFDHGDGTSGGLLTLGMLMSGVAPRDLGARWAAVPPRRFVSPLPLRQYLRSPTSWPALGDARGIRAHVLPGLGIDVARIRRASGMTGSFNVADHTTKTCVAIPHDELDEDRFLAGMSLPIAMPAIEVGGHVWTDAVWIKDANLLEAVRRGCTELWVVWCIGNTPYWGDGALEQYVHMIELSANSAIQAELEQIADLNARRAAGEPVGGTTEPITVHVVKPRFPLPLDPSFVTGRIDAPTLVAMGYRDAWRTLDAPDRGRVDAPVGATAMALEPLGARIAVAASGRIGDGPDGDAACRLHLVAELTDLAALAAGAPPSCAVVGTLHHPAWGDLPLARGEVTASGGGGARRLTVTAQVGDGAGGPPARDLVATAEVPARARPWRCGGKVAAKVRTGDGWSGGDLVVDRGAALRALVSFEPSGARTIGDRARAVALTRRAWRAASG